jgi:predicted transcriptional regulator
MTGTNPVIPTGKKKWSMRSGTITVNLGGWFGMSEINDRVEKHVKMYREILDVLKREGIHHPTAADAILHEIAKDERMEQIRGNEEKMTDNPGKYIYIYVPDGVRDREFEALLKEKIPTGTALGTHSMDNAFWSNRYGNFVVKREFAEQAEKTIEEYYGKGSLVKKPEWSQNPNTWQVVGGRKPNAGVAGGAIITGSG